MILTLIISDHFKHIRNVYMFNVWTWMSMIQHGKTILELCVFCDSTEKLYAITHNTSGHSVFIQPWWAFSSSMSHWETMYFRPNQISLPQPVFHWCHSYFQSARHSTWLATLSKTWATVWRERTTPLLMRQSVCTIDRHKMGHNGWKCFLSPLPTSASSFVAI